MYRRQLTRIVFLMVFLWGSMVSAAIPKIHAGPKKRGNYLEYGVFTGGETGKGFSILDVRRKLSKKSKRDRWIFEIGDVFFKPIQRKVPYFHISVSDEPASLHIDLFQVHRSKVNEKELTKILKQSPYVDDVSMIYDSVDGGMSFNLKLSRKTQVEAFEMPAKSKSSRLVIDLIPGR